MTPCAHNRVERLARVTTVGAELTEEYIQSLRDRMTPTCSDCGYKLTLEEFHNRMWDLEA
jgi:hypothetical protein